MKLVNKINLQFLLLLLIIFTFAGILFYIAIKMVADENIEEILESRTQRVMLFIESNPQKKSGIISPDQSIVVNEITPTKPFKHFSDTTIFDNYENERMEFRKLTSVVKINEHYYQIEITLSQLESEDMVEVISYFMCGLFAFIVIVLFVLNRWLSTTWWRPFYQTMDQLKRFKIDQLSSVEFEQTNIEEFKQLNCVLQEMMTQIIADFKNVKEFTENASHEIQTPLAIIKSKLEIILQNKDLSPDCNNQIQEAYSATSRLSKLSEALLLISKIENQQFIHLSVVDFNKLIQDRIQFIEEMLLMKNIEISIKSDQPFIHKMNITLAETLIHNLLGNAIKHNMVSGEISITITKSQIVFSNTGSAFEGDPEKIFNRFVKYSTNGESIGLGLSIVSEICKNNHLTIQYDYDDGWHHFRVKRI